MTYVVAVSGGVDSMVLLDALVHERLSELALIHDQRFTNHELMVAHFDHGIRDDSQSDEAFVKRAAGEYGLKYESQRIELGPHASEAKAREMRYNFLRRCCKKHNALLMTAHHQDDLIETMLINLIRGTGWRGLTPMTASNSKSEILNTKQTLNLNNQNSKQAPESVILDLIRNPVDNPERSESASSTNLQILRPLLNTPKTAILTYAKKYGVEWREDSTNTDESYLRNYIRRTLIPNMFEKDAQVKQKLLDIYNQTNKLQKEIATELQKILIKYQISNIKYIVPRYDLIMLPSSAAFEVIYTVLTRLDPEWHPTRKQVQRCLHFIKTGLPHKTLEVSGSLRCELSERSVQFKKV